MRAVHQASAKGRPTQQGAVRAPRSVAMRLAERIEEEVAHLPCNTRLGTESELLLRLGVSRACFRQAVRCLERNGVARSRRGAGGGLIVARSARDRATAGIETSLEMLGPPLKDLSAIRAILKREVIASAARSASEPQARAIRILAARAQNAETLHDYATLRGEFENEIANASGETTLSICLTAVSQASVRAMPLSALPYEAFRQDVKPLQAADRAIAEAIAARDSRRAENAAEEAAEIEMAAYEASLQRGLLPDPADTVWSQSAAAADAKAGERVAWLLRAQIARISPGVLLGTEPDLAAQFGVGRAIMREGLAILEVFELVQRRRGVGGGVFAGAFRPEGMARSLARRLQLAGAGKLDVLRARLPLEVESARLAASSHAQIIPSEGLSAQLSRVGANRTLSILIPLLEAAFGMDQTPSDPLEEKIARAVGEGDHILACRFSIERCMHFQRKLVEAVG